MRNLFSERVETFTNPQPDSLSWWVKATGYFIPTPVAPETQQAVQQGIQASTTFLVEKAGFSPAAANAVVGGVLAIPTGGWGIALAASGAFISTEILETDTAQRAIGGLAEVFIDLGVDPDAAYTAAGNIVGIGVGVGVGFGLAGAARGIATGLSRFEGVGRSGFRPPPNRGFAGPIEQTTLKPGALIDRYGNASGSFAAPVGTPIGQRSLPPGGESRALQTYRVLKPLKVDSGTTAASYGQPGGGTQYDFGGRSIQQLIDAGYLEVVR